MQISLDDTSCLVAGHRLQFSVQSYGKMGEVGVVTGFTAKTTDAEGRAHHFEMIEGSLADAKVTLTHVRSDLPMSCPWSPRHHWLDYYL